MDDETMMMFSKRRLTETVWFMFIIIPVSVGGTMAASDEEFKLKESLFKNYDVTSRPVLNQSDAVVIKMSLALNQVIDLDERNQILFSSIWLRYSWEDQLLRWNASDFKGLQTIHVPITDIWSPDITLYNDVREEERDLDKFLASVSSDGSVQWLAPAIFKSSCKLDVTYFPYDQQSCPLKFGSWAYHGFQLDLVNKTEEGDSSAFLDNGEWNLVGIPLKRTVLYYGCCPEPYPDVTFSIVLRRRSLYYIFNLILPCILIVCITVLGFYLPPESGEKVSLGVTVLLALTVFLLLVAEIMPPQSEVVPLIGKYFGAAIALLATSTGMTVVVMNLHYSGDHGMPVPKWLKKLTLVWLARLVCMKKVVEKNVVGMAQVSPATPRQMEQLKESKANGLNTITSDTDNLVQHIAPIKPILPPLSSAETDSKENKEVVKLLQRVVAHLDKMAKDIEHKKENRRCITEWQLVAMVVDRLLLLIFFVITVVMTTSILLYNPVHPEM